MKTNPSETVQEPAVDVHFEKIAEEAIQWLTALNWEAERSTEQQQIHDVQSKVSDPSAASLSR